LEYQKIDLPILVQENYSPDTTKRSEYRKINFPIFRSFGGIWRIVFQYSDPAPGSANQFFDIPILGHDKQINFLYSDPGP
jgi:hypothetical protein